MDDYSKTFCEGTRNPAVGLRNPFRVFVVSFRAFETVLLFAAFGIGGAILSFCVLPFVRKRETSLRLVRAVWRLLANSFVWTGLISIDRGNLAPAHGRIYAANHPSLIDVVLLVSLLPDTTAVAKQSLLRDPLISRIVRTVFLPNDEQLIEHAHEWLRRGGNVLLFPEGTRSPKGGMNPFKRGAAQLALRTGMPIVPIGECLDRRILGKGQSILDMGEHRVHYAFTAGPEILPTAEERNAPHHAAHLLTDTLHERIAALCGVTR